MEDEYSAWSKFNPWVRHHKHVRKGPVGDALIACNSNAPQNPPENDGKRQLSRRKQIRTILSSPWNLLLPVVLVGFVVRYLNVDPTIIFAVNFVAIIPLAVMLDFASDNLELATGEVVAALVNITFSNIVQLVLSILLLRGRQLQVLQTALIGTILSNMHLAVGLGFFLGGFNRQTQFFNSAAARVLGSGLLLAVAALIIPAVIKQLQAESITQADILVISRAISILLLLCYAVYLYFTNYSHRGVFTEASPKTKLNELAEGDVGKTIIATGLVATAGTAIGINQAREVMEGAEGEDEVEEPKITRVTAIVLLIILTTLLGFNAAFATDSLQALMDKTGLTDTFVGIVLLPLLGVDFFLFKMAMLDKMDLFISLTIGKSLQTCLFIIPIIVLLGWVIDVPFGLDFDPFEVIALFAAVIYINNMIQEGESNYLQGVLLLSLFVIICIVSYYVASPE